MLWMMSCGAPSAGRNDKVWVMSMPDTTELFAEKILDLTSETFNSSQFKEPYLRSGDASRFEALFTEASFDELFWRHHQSLYQEGSRQTFWRLMREHITLYPRNFCDIVESETGAELMRVSPAKVKKILQEGATLNINHIELLDDRVAQFISQLQQIFGCRSQANLYVTTRTTPGFDPHYDTHDIFVLQITGDKRWRWSTTVVGEASPSLPSRAEDAPTAWDRDEVISGGDLIYLPRGTWHLVTGVNKPSLHLTISLRYPSLEDYLSWLSRRSSKCEILRRRLLLHDRSVKNATKCILEELSAGLRDLIENGGSPTAYIESTQFPAPGSKRTNIWG
jgi:ribosomal protein L16 Arg81 hydroxylase